MTKTTRGTELSAVPNRVSPQPKIRVEKKKLKGGPRMWNACPPLLML